MTYDLFLGDRMYSSWSLRGWLMLEKFGLPYRPHMVGLYTGTMAADLAPLAPARLVPVLRTPDGTIVGETLAIAETLAERHPQAGLWPADPAARATARWLCAEMSTSFAALRAACPMQLQRQYHGFAPTAAVVEDLARLDTIWAHARAISGQTVSGQTGGWLFGTYSLADVFYTPVAARLVGYDLPISDAARSYAIELLSDPAVRAWRQQAREITYDPEPYACELPATAWPIAD